VAFTEKRLVAWPNGTIVIHPRRPGFFSFHLYNPILCSSAAFLRESIADVLMPALSKRQDYAFWHQLRRQGLRFCNIQRPLVAYRCGRRDSVSGSKASLLRHNYLMYRRALSYDMGTSAACASINALGSVIKTQLLPVIRGFKGKYRRLN